MSMDKTCPISNFTSEEFIWMWSLSFQTPRLEQSSRRALRNAAHRAVDRAADQLLSTLRRNRRDPDSFFPANGAPLLCRPVRYRQEQSCRLRRIDVWIAPSV